jgi:mono/diheme cytochrome c family protein
MKKMGMCLGVALFAIGGLVAIDVLAATSANVAEGAQRGADLYKVHCAACHGQNGAGSGLTTPQLRHVPPDLTQLSKKNGGMFPQARVRRIIEGRDVPSHGERDMPVWGDAFTTAGTPSRESSDARIATIIAYLDSIQTRSSH